MTVHVFQTSVGKNEYFYQYTIESVQSADHGLVTVLLFEVLQNQGAGGGSEKFCKSMKLNQTLKWPYLDNFTPKKALDRCIRILPPQRIFLAIKRNRVIY